MVLKNSCEEDCDTLIMTGMSLSRQERRKLRQKETKMRRKLGVSRTPHVDKPATSRMFSLMLVSALILAGGLGVWKYNTVYESKPSVQKLALAKDTLLPAIADLVKMTDDELSKVGIAKMNLACAQGLSPHPMTNAEVKECLQNQQRMANAVRLHTANNHYKFVVLHDF